LELTLHRPVRSSLKAGRGQKDLTKLSALNLDAQNRMDRAEREVALMKAAMVEEK
jgi:hypothetical protein